MRLDFLNSIFLVIALPLLSVGCATENKPRKTDTYSSADKNCQVVLNKLYNAQIRYFDGMNLRLPSCPATNDFKFEQKHIPVAQEIWRELDLKPWAPLSDFLYVNIEFYGSTLPDGTIVIHHVETAKITDDSIYD